MIAPRDGEMLSAPARKPVESPQQPEQQGASCPSGGPSHFSCLFCGTPMYGVHCKLNCPNCGYKEDCSDLFQA